ncbi:MAG: hypothetical protein MUE73_10870, partial [Planctomycetes bacterium]|nr:hypothetical protein [Planctomycetota bacterium]
MIAPLRLLRSAGIFLAFFVAGTGLLLLVPGMTDRPVRKGMRLAVVEGEGPAGSPIAEGMPSRLTALGLAQSRFRTVTFPDGEGVTPREWRYMAWHIACGRVDLTEETAEDVVFRLFPVPTTREEATAGEVTPPDPFAVIRSALARVHRKFVPVAGGGEEEEWEIALGGGVEVESRRRGRDASLTADNLTCLAMERRVRATGKVRIVSQEHRIEGTGMAGDAALGTFAVERDVRVSLPTAAILPGGSAAPGDETVIACRGPLLVERLDDGEPSLTRVTFSGDVSVTQTSGLDTLHADHLTLLLLVARAATDGVAPQVTAKEVEATGGVELDRAPGSLVRGSRLSAKREENAERLEIDGPVVVRYEGVVAGGGPGSAGADPEELSIEVTAKDRAVLTGDPAADVRSAVFTGDARARRLAKDGAELLSVSAPEISVASGPSIGEEMAARGGAAFATPTVRGSADDLTWKRAPDGGPEEIVLSGNPKVSAKVAPGSAFDPFSAGPGTAGAPLSSIDIESTGPLTLVTAGNRRTFLVDRRSVVTKSEEGHGPTRVTADRLTVSVAGSDIESLSADGAVEASGELEGGSGGLWFASGAAFRFTPADARAVLTGAPAEVRLVEEAGRVNRIQAPTLVFFPETGSFRGEGGVRSTVFLRSGERSDPEPFSLDCGVLSVTAAKEPDPAAGPVARIAALEAEGGVTLSGPDRTARGERLRYDGGATREVTLTGGPASVTQRTIVHGEELRDEFRSPSFRLRLRERDIAGFEAASGGSFVLHRPLGAGATTVMGSGAPRSRPGEEKQVERFTGSCTGPMSFDSAVARMTGNAVIEQEIGLRGSFRRVARFQAELIEARRGTGADGKQELLSAEGRGGVVGTGEAWRVLCDRFEVDFRAHRTTVTGKPARFSRRGGADQLV